MTYKELFKSFLVGFAIGCVIVLVMSLIQDCAKMPAFADGAHQDRLMPDDSHIAGIEIDPLDMTDVGKVDFFVVYGAKAQALSEHFGGKLLLYLEEQKELIFRKPEVDASADGKMYEEYDGFEFKVLGGPSADKVLAAQTDGGNLFIDVEGKLIVLVHMAPQVSL